MIAASVSAELFKLRKRPATLLIAAILAGIVLLFSYLVLYLVVRAAGAEMLGAGPDPEAVVEFLLPGSIAAALASNVSQTGGALALVLGALISGSEYSWRTAATIATQRPPRSAIMIGKIVAMVAAAAGLTIVGLAAVTVGAYTIALLEAGPYSPPAISDLLAAIGVGWLVLSVWGLVGLALGVVFRGPAIAIGVGLVYAFVLESAMVFVPVTVPGGAALRRATLGSNAAALAEMFPSADAFTGALPPGPAISPGAAIAVLAAYALASGAVAVVLFQRRELA